MKTCMIISVRDYELVKNRVEQAINILGQERVTKKDRMEALDALFVIKAALRENLPEVTKEDW